MTVLRGRRLAAAGAAESYTVTRPAPTEHTGLTTVLPTTEPGTSQISVTVASGDFYLPAGLEAPYVGVLLAQVLNNDASSRTVSWRIRKNGTSVANGSTSTSASARFRIQGYFSPTAVSGDSQGVGVLAGDVLELRLWAASSTNVQLVYWTYWLQDTRTRVKGAPGLQDISSWDPNGTYPALASWPGTGAGANSTGFMHLGDNTNVINTQPASVPSPLRGLWVGGYGLIRQNSGDFNTSNAGTGSAAANPTYLRSSTALNAITARRISVF